MRQARYRFRYAFVYVLLPSVLASAEYADAVQSRSANHLGLQVRTRTTTAGRASSDMKSQPRLGEATTFITKHAGTIVIAHLLLGTICLSVLESWSPSDACYFCVTTLTTVGFGDVAPKTASGRFVTALYILFGASLVASCLGTLVGRMQAQFIEKATAPAGVSGMSRELNEVVNGVGFAAAIVATGIAYASVVEGWSFVDAFYWACVSCSSVGLGDLVPSPVMRPIAGIYLLIGVGGFATSVGRVARYTAALELGRRRDAFLERGVTAELLDDLGEKDGGQVGRYAFMRYMLVASGQMEEAEMIKIDALFDALDVDGSGSLDAADMRNDAASVGSVMPCGLGGRGMYIGVTSHASSDIEQSPKQCSSFGMAVHAQDSEESVDDSAALLRSMRSSKGTR